MVFVIEEYDSDEDVHNELIINPVGHVPMESLLGEVLVVSYAEATTQGCTVFGQA